MNMENQSQFYVSGLIDLFMLTVHILYSTWYGHIGIKLQSMILQFLNWLVLKQ